MRYEFDSESQEILDNLDPSDLEGAQKLLKIYEMINDKADITDQALTQFLYATSVSLYKGAEVIGERLGESHHTATFLDVMAGSYAAATLLVAKRVAGK